MKKIFSVLFAAGIFFTLVAVAISTSANANAVSTQTNPCRNGKVTVQMFTSSGVPLNSYRYYDSLSQANAAIAAYNPPGGFTYLAIVCDSTGTGVEP